ncbi:MAG TPA: terminase large subunit, partial [Pirellulales bacterium]
LDPWQAADFAALDPAWQRVAGSLDPSPSIAAKIGEAIRGMVGPAPPDDGIARRAYLERPRGHSKTADLAVMVAWVLFASPRRLAGVAAAADKDQARLLRDAVAKLTALNAWLASYLDAQVNKIINPHTGSTLDILSADAPSSYGLTPDFIVVDELTHWPREELWHSLLSSAAKRRHCLLVIIANAGLGQGESWQWRVRANAETDPAWYFHSLDGPQASWIHSTLLDEQRRLLPDQAYRRLWLNQWATGAGDALTADDIDAAVRAARPMEFVEPHCAYIAAVDIGHRHDKTAVVVLAADGVKQVVRLADVREFAPGKADVNLMVVEDCLLALHRKFRLHQVIVDPSQAVLLIQRLRSAGIYCTEHAFTATNMQRAASCLLDAFRSRRIELYPHDSLLRGLRSLRVEERPNSGGFRLTAPRDKHGHADAAIALSIGLPTALELMQQGGVIDMANLPILDLPGGILGDGIDPRATGGHDLRTPGSGAAPGIEFTCF